MSPNPPLHPEVAARATLLFEYIAIHQPVHRRKVYAWGSSRHGWTDDETQAALIALHLRNAIDFADRPTPPRYSPRQLLVVA